MKQSCPTTPIAALLAALATGCSCGFAAHLGSHIGDTRVDTTAADVGAEVTAADGSASMCRSQDIRFVNRAPTQQEVTACSLDVLSPTNWFWNGSQCVAYSFQECRLNRFCEGSDCANGAASFDVCYRAHRDCVSACGLALEAPQICVQTCDGRYVDTPTGTGFCRNGAVNDFNQQTRTHICNCDHCRAQDAREDDPNCSNPVPARYAWTGADCTRVCSCVGNDCAATFENRRACLEAFAGCARSMCSAHEIEVALSTCGGATAWRFTGSACQPVPQCACNGLDCARLFTSESECTALAATCRAQQCPTQTGRIEISALSGLPNDYAQWYLSPGWRYEPNDGGPAGYQFFVNGVMMQGTTNAASPQEWYPAGRLPRNTIASTIVLQAVSPCGTWQSTYVPAAGAAYPLVIDNLRIEWTR